MIDRRDLDESLEKIGLKNYKKVTKIMFWILSPVLVAVGILLFVLKLIPRFILDIKEVCKMFLERMEE